MTNQQDARSEPNANRFLLRLRRLWKGTLYIAIATIYIGLLAWVFLSVGWLSSLLVLGLIALSQIFRFIAEDVYKIGLAIQDDDLPSTNNEATRFQRLLRVLLAFLVWLPIVAIVLYLVFTGGDWLYYSALFGLVLAEWLFLEVRRTNRAIAFREASYGLNPSTVALGTPEHESVDKARDEDLEARLATLKTLVDEGKVSQAAYEKARDKYWVRRVMNPRQ